MSPAPRWPGSAGFTLVEALIATVLMSIILTALGTITAQWLPSWDRGVLRLQRADLLALSLERLTDDLAAAEFVSAGPGTQAKLENPIFDGTTLSVSFARTTLSPSAGSGLELVHIAEIGDERGPALVRSTAPLPVNATASGAFEEPVFFNPVVLIRAPFRVSFSYAGPDRVWRDAWHAEPALPQAVRVQVRDNATSALLAVTTSTLIHAELPARCTRAVNVSDCPFVAALGRPDAGSGSGSGAGAGGGAVGTR